MSTNATRGLTTIIVPCWNEVEFTQQCLAALRRHTREPWELIVVDNGSTDGTATYLAGVRDMAAVPVTVISNTTNLGFPAAVNQGLRLARGEYLVLLNNDVVVTDAWLDQLIGLVNASSGPSAGARTCAGDGNGFAGTSSPPSVDIVRGSAESTPPNPPSRSGGTTLGQGCSPSLPTADCVLPIVPTTEIRTVGHAVRPTPPGPPFTRGGKVTVRAGVDPTGAGVEEHEPLAAPSSLPAANCALPAVRPIGLAGPMSNFAAPPQLVEDVPYRDVAGMHDFARRWRGEHLGKWFTAHKLSGFCLLIKRAVYDKIGGLDERFGLGLFDDDDLAERARRAGFELAVARDLFVHHFGSRTFAGNGIDTGKLLDENARRFAAKWGLSDGNNGRQRVALRSWRQPKEVGDVVVPAGPGAIPGGRGSVRAGGGHRGSPGGSPSQDRAEAVTDAPGCVRVAWEGDFEALHSLAIVNRAICRGLIDRGHDVNLFAGHAGPAVEPHERVELDGLLAQARLTRAGGPAARDVLMAFDAQVHVRHRWPPDNEPPARGKSVLMQPWEFGSLPKAWLPILRRVDEVWAYSRFVRDCYLEAEVPRDKVHVVPLGIAPEVFRPGLEPLPLAPGPQFRLLFVGGTIYRKGIDLLLTAFARAFRPADGVGLVIKEMGSKSFYRGQTAEVELAALREQGHAVEYIDRTLSEAEIAQLYCACDALVHPFRGEGFGMPIVEAMACGLPVVVTGAGPVLDYASEKSAYFIPAERRTFGESSVDGMETIGQPWLFEPDIDALVELLKRVVGDRDRARAAGTAASAHIREHFTWERSVEAVERRLRALTGGEMGRTSDGASGDRGVLAGTLASVSGWLGARDPRSGLIETLAGASGWCDGQQPAPVKALRTAKVSLTMIVKNEQENLPRCLASIEAVFDEIIVVDTGSTDRTKEIAREFGARVFDFEWIDDFAAARNAALSHATGDYAFWLDADDVVEPAEREKMLAMLVGLARPSTGGTAGRHSPVMQPLTRPMGDLSPDRGDSERSRERHSNGSQVAAAAYVVRCACDPSPDGTGGDTVVDHIRLFPLRDDVRWTYRVHEQILPALRRVNVPVRWTDLTVRHTGYVDKELRARKLERDTKILERELEERPNDPFVLFNLGAVAVERREWHEALGFLKRSLAGSAPTDSIVRKLFALIARAHQMMGDSRGALGACAKGLKLDREDAELWFRKAVVHRQRGESSEAERCWRLILTLKRPDQFCSVDQGIYGHLTRRNLAALAAERGDHVEVRRLWESVLAECPGDREAMARLG